MQAGFDNIITATPRLSYELTLRLKEDSKVNAVYALKYNAARFAYLFRNAN